MMSMRAENWLKTLQQGCDAHEKMR